IAIRLHHNRKIDITPKKHPIAPQIIPAIAIPFPPPSAPSLVTCIYPMIPKITARIDGTAIHDVGSPMIPSTSDATQNPLLVPLASSVVPSIVNGIPHALQLLAVTGDSAEHRGHRMFC